MELKNWTEKTRNTPSRRRRRRLGAVVVVLNKQKANFRDYALMVNLLLRSPLANSYYLKF